MIPGLQSVQDVEPALLEVPGEHSWHFVLLGTLENKNQVQT